MFDLWAFPFSDWLFKNLIQGTATRLTPSFSTPAPSVSYQGKLVGDPTIRWQLGSEPQCGKHLIAVVVLDDFSYCLQGHGVGIQLVRTHVVEWGGLGWVTCLWQREHTVRGCGNDIMLGQWKRWCGHSIKVMSQSFLKSSFLLLKLHFINAVFQNKYSNNNLNVLIMYYKNQNVCPFYNGFGNVSSFPLIPSLPKMKLILTS